MTLKRFRCCIIRYRKEKYIITFSLAFVVIFQYAIKGHFDTAVANYMVTGKTSEDDLLITLHHYIRIFQQLSAIVGYPTCGVISDLYGGKFVLLAGIFVNICLSIGLPLALSKWPWWGIAILVLCVGLAQAMVLAPLPSLVAYWIRNDEMSFYLSFIHCGGFMGVLAMFMVTSVPDFSRKMYMIRWLYTFYGVVAFLLVLLTIFSAPWKHPCMSANTKEILSLITGDKFPKKIRWKDIIKDPATWSVCMGITGHKWMFFSIFANLEMHYKYVNLARERTTPIGWFVQMPAVFGFAGGVVSGIVTTKIIQAGKVPFVYIRTMNNIIAGVICCILMLVANAPRDNIYIEIPALLLAVFCLGVGVCGSHANVYDITRHYSSSVCGVANSMQCVIIFMVSVANAFLVDEELKKTHWENVLWFSFFVCLVCIILCFVWMETERRPWDQVIIEEYEEEYEEEEN